MLTKPVKLLRINKAKISHLITGMGILVNRSLTIFSIETYTNLCDSLPRFLNNITPKLNINVKFLCFLILFPPPKRCPTSPIPLCFNYLANMDPGM